MCLNLTFIKKKKNQQSAFQSVKYCSFQLPSRATNTTFGSLFEYAVVCVCCGLQYCPIMGGTHISMMTDDVKQLFTCLPAFVPLSQEICMFESYTHYCM